MFVKVLDKFEIENENVEITFYAGNNCKYIRECVVPE